MHDPMTQAFVIRYPWGDTPSKTWPKGYRHAFVTIWHRDPGTDRSDDSCGWFQRARHGDSEVLRQIVSSFTFEWDSDSGGWFDKDGNPRLSVLGIALNMFHHAARHHFGENASRRERFMKRHLLEILIFAENPVDSLHPYITNRYGRESREERINHLASIVYGCVLRWSRPWWKHPRWHIHHWTFQIHPWQALRRRIWDRCCKCGKRGFAKGESAMGDWGGTRIWHQRCDGTAAAVVSPQTQPPATVIRLAK